MSLLMPSKEEMEVYVANIGIMPKHNYLIVYRKMKDSTKSFLKHFARSASVITRGNEKPYYLIVTKNELILQEMKKHSEMIKFLREDLKEFMVSDGEGETKVIEFNYSGETYSFIAHKDSIDRVRYVADNLQYLDQHHWLEEIEL
ncbi:hypothetical protein [Breznakia pachnodae]|uniref:N-acetylglutamate synthase/N-acetylornithine aminotransferase n=1 Tax=Breznakia pachnodae TaxID=265178 RepID=A0ABU0E3G9_9FIRM|nr:hypothetical protein [Breznakia pachnodae]MDQ0361435.1 N-acetylglutamate synthase/N-acetylornithine aminotransferase [Breznakia pachnodae]